MADLPTEASFRIDVAKHEMAILHDDGLYRNIRFSAPETNNLHFNVTTWPGYLCFSGDMGCYVFSRLEDMLEFFRGKATGKLEFDRGYWAQKLQAVAKGESDATEFSVDKFKKVLLRIIKESRPLKSIVEEFREEVWSLADDNVEAFKWAAYNFSSDGFRFDDLWEYDTTEYTYHFIWCCYALAWAVRQYDNKP